MVTSTIRDRAVSFILSHLLYAAFVVTKLGYITITIVYRPPPAAAFILANSSSL